MLQKAVMNLLETNEKLENLSKKWGYKKEPNGI